MSKEIGRALFGWKYRHLVKPVLFCFPPDNIHELFLSFGRQLGRSRVVRSGLRKLWRYDHPVLAQTVGSLHFRNPIGLSAGFDYRADLVDILPAIGFGFHTVGTLTIEPYSGNPRPMMERLPRSRSLLVNKGFKNDGLEVTLARLRPKTMPDVPRGMSIGATNRTYADFSEMLENIVAGFRVAERSPLFDYYELNISCPNLQNLANLKPELASPDGVSLLLARLAPLGLQRPVFIKLPLERTEDEMRALIEPAVSHPFITGLIFSKLAKDRTNPAFHPDEIARAGRGNFSGKPTEQQSNALLRFAYRHYRDRFVFIGVGGVFTAEDAYEKIRSGATLVQLITGMIFMGPQHIGAINAGLLRLLRRDGYANMQEAIGTGVTEERRPKI